ncbi:hypothetical protein HOR67_gp48 [Ralstonia phage RS-PI-1]|uniref:Uncharacterized protein n=1 Tax=Ralstonia phage RS-PI-1 TaxID=1958965 RepID=A0A1S6L1E7_9CAUD|nr:hypothetical protein HOR67_gp48 [Ralstonia phage RS-PI-1]AQT27810.1 hypothetical protein [Ralstonia phage RS-PI-1]
MTKKHFEALAASICNISDDTARAAAARAVANVCLQFNKSFNTARFYDACDVKVPAGWASVEG